MSIRKGEPWGEPAVGPPDVELTGSDAELADLARDRPGVSVRYRPSSGSDVARGVGLDQGNGPGRLDVPFDVLRVVDGDVRNVWAANALVLGTPPDRLGPWSRRIPVDLTVDGRHRFTGRATTVVLATGQFLREHDLVPRGHPGDGRFEIQAYAVPRRERTDLRARLVSGAHLPHPGIGEWSGCRADVAWASPVRLEVDGEDRGRVRSVTVEIVPGALRLRV